MTRYPSTRKRVELPADLYAEIAKDAERLHMPVQTLITSMLARTLGADRALAKVPWKDRKPAAATAKPSKKGLSSFYAAGLAVSQEIEEELAATREARRVRE